MDPEPPIRRLTADDHEVVIRLWLRAGLHTIRTQGRDSAESFRRQIARGLLIPLGIEEEGKLIAVVLATHDGRKGWINRLAVDPPCRRRGLGVRLVRAAEEALRSEDIHVIAALVESDNQPSFELFRGLGYAEVDRGMHYLSKRETERD